MASLTDALPLVQGISNRITFLIVDYFFQNTWTKDVFINAMYPYAKTDVDSLHRPTLFCKPNISGKETFSGEYNGSVILELKFSFKEQRELLTQNMVQIAGLIELIVLSQRITEFCQHKMPGLYWIGKHCKTDYSKAYKKEAIIKIEMDYNVNLLGYSNGLQEKGFDIISPDEQIYFEAKDLIMKIDILNKDLETIIEV